MLNPSIATIVLPAPTATQFRFRYFVAGVAVADIELPALYNNAGSYVQPLAAVNALVTPSVQGASMTLVVNAINEGGESLPTTCPTPVVVILPPDPPVTVVLS